MKILTKFILLLFINLILIVLLLFSAELFLKIFKPHRLYQRTYLGEYQNHYFNKKSSWFSNDKDLGWVFNKGNVIHSSEHNNVFYKTNQQDFRDDKDFNLDSLEPGKRRIMILGDSFIFGQFINQEDTIPELLQKRLGDKYLVYNLGIPGWGIDQMYWAYKNIVIKLSPIFVFYSL